MFNAIDFELSDNIANAHNKKLLESEQHEIQRKKNARNELLGGLETQYKNLYENSITRSFNSKMLTESAIISCMRDITYNIFESSLLIDDEPKAYYSDVIKENFDKEYANLLKENSVTNLTSFKAAFGKSNKIYGSILETVSNIAFHNMDIYNTILEDTRDSSTSRLFIEAYNVLSEADTSADTKGAKLKSLIDNVKSKLVDFDANQVVTTGVEVNRIIIMVISFGSMFLVYINPLLGLVTSFLALIAALSMNKHQAKNYPKYLKDMENIRKNLRSLKMKTDKDSKEYKAINTKLDRCDQIIQTLKTRIAVQLPKNESAIDNICEGCNKMNECDQTSPLMEACHKKKTEGSEETCGNKNKALQEAVDAGDTLLSDMNNDNVEAFSNSVKAAVAVDDDINDSELLLDTINRIKVEASIDQCAIMKSMAILTEATLRINYSFLTEGAKTDLKGGSIPTEDNFFGDDDKALFDDMAGIHGKNFAIQKIKDKVVQIISDEEEAATEKKKEDDAFLNSMTPEQLEDVKDSISESSGMKLGSSRLNIPDSLFSAIVMNRSKKMLQESTTENSIIANKETILSESITLYTMHETLNTLNLRQYTPEVTRKFMNNYYYNKI